MTDEVTVIMKGHIDSLSHLELCRIWRFSQPGDVRLQGANGDYFKERLFEHFGGFTPKISKWIGW